MIIVNSKNEKPVMQGKTTIEANETIMHGETKGIDTVCRACNYPFALSLQEIGSILNGSILCNYCKNELAYVVEK